MTNRAPRASKQLRGTLRPDRDTAPALSECLLEIPAAPAGLSEPATLEWQSLAKVLIELGVLRGADLRALQMLAETLASVSNFEQIVLVEGATISSSGGTRGHPALTALATARSQARQLLNDFGLTPRGRESAAAPGPAEPNPFAKFRDRPDPMSQFKFTR